MRQSSRQQNAVTLSNVQGYHQGGYCLTNREAYAFLGFKSNKYFTSDRYIPLNNDYKRVDGKEVKGYGLEIESECWNIQGDSIYAEVLNNIIFKQFPDDLFKLQRDSTLSAGKSSAECITQIMTKEFIRNNYRAFKTMFDVYFPAFGASCYRSGHCGMHVNVSVGCFGANKERQADAIRKLYYIINKHYNTMLILLYRRPEFIDWCRRMQYDKNYCQTLDLTAMSPSHTNCFNGSHYAAGRVELRLAGGHDSFAAFRNTCESVFWLVDRVKSISWSDCDDLVKIFTGCNNYVFDRLTRCRNRGVMTDEQINAIQPTVARVEYI